MTEAVCFREHITSVCIKICMTACVSMYVPCVCMCTWVDMLICVCTWMCLHFTCVWVYLWERGHTWAPLSVCGLVYICIGLYVTHTHISTHTHSLHAQILIHIHRSKHLYTDMYIDTFIDTFTCSRTYTFHIHSCTYICKQTQVHIDIHIIIHMYTLTCSQVQNHLYTYVVVCVCSRIREWKECMLSHADACAHMH